MKKSISTLLCASLIFGSTSPAYAVAANSANCSSQNETMEVCGNANATSEVVTKMNKDKNKKSSDYAKKEADDFIDAQFKKKVDKHDGSNFKRDKDFRSNTVAGQVYETYRGEYNSWTNAYKDFAAKNCPTVKAKDYSTNSGCQDQFISQQKKFKPENASPFYNDMLDANGPYGFKKLLSQESGKSTMGLSNVDKDEVLEELIQKRAEQDSKKMLEEDRGRIENAYRLMQADLEKKKEIMNKKGDGTQKDRKWDYKDLSINDKLNVSKQVFVVDPGDAKPSDVIADLYSRDPKVYGCHEYTNPPVVKEEKKLPEKDPPKKVEEPKALSCQYDDCSLKSFFKDDVAAFGADGDARIRECIDAAIEKCGFDKSLVTGVHVDTNSCASTVPSRKFSSNLELSKARSDFMKSRTEVELSKMKSELPNAKMDVSGDAASYEGKNLGLDGNPTGTCGPLPPEHIPVEGWGKPASCSNTSNMSKQQAREDLVSKGRQQAGVECDGKVSKTPGYDWLCDDAYVGVRGKKNDSYETKVKNYEKVYGPYRKAGLKITVTAKPKADDLKDPNKNEVEPGKAIDPKAKTMIKCFKLGLGYKSKQQYDDYLFDFNIGGRGPSERSVGNKKSNGCWLNGSQGVISDSGSEGRNVQILKYKYWKVINKRGDDLDADETDMWYGW